MTIPTWIGEVQAFGIPTITLGAALIAWQQYRIAKQKLRLDLYGKRYSVYTSLIDGIIVSLNEGASEVFNERTRELNLAIREARFLFDKNVFEFLNHIETDILSYRYESIKMRDPSFFEWVEAQEFATSHHARGKRLLAYMTSLPNRLHRYLSIDDTLSMSLVKSSEIERSEEAFIDGSVMANA